MKLTIFFDHRFILRDTGNIESPIHYNYSLFAERYLPHFGSIDLVARSPLPLGVRRPLGKDIDIVSAGEWNGPLDFVVKRSAITRLIHSQLSLPTSVIAIVPGLLGGLAFPLLKSRSIPYAVEVVGDPCGSMGPGTSKHPLREVMRIHMSRQLRSICKGASCAAYVTQDALQKLYPPSSEAYVTNYSSIELNLSDLVDKPRVYPSTIHSAKLVCIGTMEHLYKGQDLLIESMKECIKILPDIQLTLVGDGKYRGRLENQVVSLGLQDSIFFTGKLPPGDAVKQQFDYCDLYVLPTRGEGLPRTIIEAMARGVPCVASRVSGVPELIPNDCLVEPGNPVELADKIITMLRDSVRMSALSAINLEQSRNYLREILATKRNKFYTELLERST